MEEKKRERELRNAEVINQETDAAVITVLSLPPTSAILSASHPVGLVQPSTSAAGTAPAPSDDVTGEDAADDVADGVGNPQAGPRPPSVGGRKMSEYFVPSDVRLSIFALPLLIEWLNAIHKQSLQLSLERNDLPEPFSVVSRDLRHRMVQSIAPAWVSVTDASMLPASVRPPMPSDNRASPQASPSRVSDERTGAARDESDDDLAPWHPERRRQGPDAKESSSKLPELSPGPALDQAFQEEVVTYCFELLSQGSRIIGWGKRRNRDQMIDPSDIHRYPLLHLDGWSYFIFYLSLTLFDQTSTNTSLDFSQAALIDAIRVLDLLCDLHELEVISRAASSALKTVTEESADEHWSLVRRAVPRLTHLVGMCVTYPNGRVLMTPYDLLRWWRNPRSPLEAPPAECKPGERA